MHLVNCSLRKCLTVAFSVDISVVKIKIRHKKVNRELRQEHGSQLEFHLCTL